MVDISFRSVDFQLQDLDLELRSSDLSSKNADHGFSIRNWFSMQVLCIQIIETKIFNLNLKSRSLTPKIISGSEAWPKTFDFDFAFRSVQISMLRHLAPSNWTQQIAVYFYRSILNKNKIFELKAKTSEPVNATGNHLLLIKNRINNFDSEQANYISDKREHLFLIRFVSGAKRMQTTLFSP